MGKRVLRFWWRLRRPQVVVADLNQVVIINAVPYWVRPNRLERIPFINQIKKG